jgi:hypothetical protein
MKFFTILLIVYSSHTWAKLSISPIYDGEFNMDNAACWLQNSKEDVFIHGEDSNTVKMKVNGQIISFHNALKSLKKSKFECGKKFDYNTEDKMINLKVDLKKSNTKSNKCIANILLVSKKENVTMKNLYLNCDDE